MIPWLLATGAALLGAALMAAGFWLGRTQSYSALEAAKTLSTMTLATSEQLVRTVDLAGVVAQSGAETKEMRAELASLTSQVQDMGETLTQMLAAFVNRGLIRVETREGKQAGEVAPKPDRMPLDSIKRV